MKAGMAGSQRRSRAWLLALLVAGGAQAQDDSGGWLDNFGFSFGGFVRIEGAYSTSGTENPNNALGDIFNGQSIPRQAYVPPALLPVIIGLPGTEVGTWTTMPVPAAAASDASAPAVRGVDSHDNSGTPLPMADNDFNYQVLRAEVEGGLRFGQDLKLIARLRAMYDPGWYDEFDARTVEAQRGGISGGDPALYAGSPNYFEYRVEGDESPNPLEWAGPNYQVYFPALFLEYNRGPLNLRVGNQQIAWGQAIFFRVLDVVDGLDLRRHSVLDYAQEEFADKRVPALGLRLGYQLSDAFLADGYVQKFQPTIVGNPNTQYNVIPVGFTVHDLYSEGGYDEKHSYGLRLKGNFGQWGVQAIAAERFNPDGVYRWTRSGVRKGLPETQGSLGEFVNQTLTARGLNSADVLAETAFEVAPGGVYSATEWFNYAAQVRLNGIEGLNAAIREYPASYDVYASEVQTYQEAFNELNTFFIAAGGSLRGHIAREYFREHVFGLGASYVTEGEPGGLLDQLIINLEASYTPDRTFTNPTLSREYIEEDAWVGALVMEKYYRISTAFPATYFVFQYMYRSVDDLFGRHLSGYGGSETEVPQGVDGANYLVFAFQQPFPQDIYRIGFSLLYDPRGSLLVQPGIKWKPSGAWTIEGFYSYINGDLGDNPNETLLSTADFADEFTLRVGFQF